MKTIEPSMNTIRRSFLILAASLTGGGFVSAATENFDNLNPGPLPSPWEGALYGPRIDKPGVRWPVVASPEADRGNVLRLNGTGGRARAIKSDVRIRDGYFEVQGKTMPRRASRPDRPQDNPLSSSIGVIWRWQDPSNYYHAVAFTDKLFCSKVVNGVETTIQKSPVVKPRTGEWQTVRVEFTGQTIKVFLNGQELYTAADIVEDPGLGGDIRSAGAVGVWTNEHCETYFDKLSYGTLAFVQNEDFEDMYPLPPSGAHGGSRITEQDFASAGSCGPIKAPWKFGSTRDAARAYPIGKPYWEIVEHRGGYATATHFGHDAFKKTVITHSLRQSGWGAHVWCVKSDTSIRDGYVEVLGKLVSGELERHIGVIWRYQDEKNYYVARADALEDSVVVFKIINGLRTAVERSRMIRMPADVWNLLRVEFSGNRFRVMWNGDVLYTAVDDDIAKPGAVGLWTKQDAVTLYDNFSCGGTFAALP